MASSPRRSYLTSTEACALLGVKPATLYAYASRGQVHVVPGRGPRASLYLADDVDRLRGRSRARLAQGPIAGAALNFGEPVLETSLVRIAQDRLYYRGVDVLDLVREDVPFEAVAELLWTGVRLDGPIHWRLTDRRLAKTVSRTRMPGETPLARLRRAVAAVSCAQGEPGAAPPEEEYGAARQLVLALVPLLSRAGGADRSAPDGLSVARRVTRALGVPEGNAWLVNRILVLVAEHELNSSSFVARVASSTRAALFACLEAALAAHSGPRHGGYSFLVETQLARLRTVGAARRWARERLEAGRHLTGFGQPVYPEGDPRAWVLLDAARELWPAHPELERADAIVEEAQRLARIYPNLDFALGTLARIWNLPAGTIGAVFALGRMAGWTAHVVEQRASPAIIRPRAKYVGA